MIFNRSQWIPLSAAAGFAGAIVSAGSAADREPQALAIAFLVMALAAVTGLALAGRAAASTTATAA